LFYLFDEEQRKNNKKDFEYRYSIRQCEKAIGGTAKDRELSQWSYAQNQESRLKDIGTAKVIDPSRKSR
jgi:hypothetical protein